MSVVITTDSQPFSLGTEVLRSSALTDRICRWLHLHRVRLSPSTHRSTEQCACCCVLRWQAVLALLILGTLTSFTGKFIRDRMRCACPPQLCASLAHAPRSFVPCHSSRRVRLPSFVVQ